MAFSSLIKLLLTKSLQRAGSVVEWFEKGPWDFEIVRINEKQYQL